MNPSLANPTQRASRHGARILDTRGEAFNVFNAINYDEYVGALSSPLVGRPVSAFPSRRVQPAVIVGF